MNSFLYLPFNSVYLFSDTMEARYLYNYAQSLELLDDDPLNNPELTMDGLNR